MAPVDHPHPNPPPSRGRGHDELGSFGLLDLLQITDRSFPTGGFVHSYGLEWLVKHQPIDLETVLRMRLTGQLARFELVFAARAYQQDVVELDEQFHAMTLARESREASIQVGRALLRTACDLFARSELDVAARGMPYGHHPVVFGLVAHALGIPVSTAAAAYAFQSIRGQISAAQRLTRLGQSEAQRLLHRIKPEIEQAVELALEYPLGEAAPFAPLLDIASMAHERSEVRLFVS